MRITISGRHVDVTPALRSHVESRLEKVRNHFDHVLDADVVLQVEKHRHIADITVHLNGLYVHGRVTSEDMYSSIDAASDKLEKQVQRYKNRINRAQQRNRVSLHEIEHQIIEMAASTEEAPSAGTEPRHRVVEQKTLKIKVLTVDEATLQLEMIDQAFLVFSNVDTQRINVLYQLESGKFGLLVPPQ